jgi:hypothetical protein
MSWMWISIALTLTVVAMVLVARLLVPAVSEASERIRIQREAQAASWRIHQQAAAAFGQMLDAARPEAQEES